MSQLNSAFSKYSQYPTDCHVHETGHRAEVTCIIRSPRKDTFAVGYADGSIRLWDSGSGSVISTFNGHKKSVTAPLLTTKELV